jgi:UDP-N-acetylmuramoyl-tripeptide--D-alanyl-D-alanine ligase
MKATSTFRLIRERIPYRPRDLPALLATPIGRRQLRFGLIWLCWPLFRPMGWLWRRVGLRATRIVAVTGSFGKTTTVRAVRVALDERTDRWSRNAKSFLALPLLASSPRVDRMVLEVGISRPGQMRAYGKLLRPDVAVVTSIGSEHLLSLGTLERTTVEKGRLVEALRPGGLAILNGDDPRARTLAARSSARFVTVGFEPHNDYRAERIELDWPNGSRLLLSGPGFQRTVTTGLLGAAQLRSILVAVAVGIEFGEPLDRLLERLAGLRPAPGRLQPEPLASGAWLLRDEFKSTFETYQVACDLVAQIPGRRFAVLGDITEPSGSQRTRYRELGALLGPLFERVVYLGSQAQALTSSLVRAGLARERVTHCDTVQQAAALLQQELRSGDVVLLKGRTTDRIERVALLLQGRTVACGLKLCRAQGIDCASCPMLERGWAGRRPVT